MKITVKMPNSESSGNIAEITLNPETKGITNITFHQKHLRLRCQRCATFCCKLGGPKLTQRDIEHIKQASYLFEDFLEPLSDKEFKGLTVMRCSLKNKEDGSCAFLRFNEERSFHECSIYDVRPALCRLYPLDFEKIGPHSFVLKLIPCCRGLHASRGELVNEDFVTDNLLRTILDLMIECDAHAYPRHGHMDKDGYERV